MSGTTIACVTMMLSSTGPEVCTSQRVGPGDDEAYRTVVIAPDAPWGVSISVSNSPPVFEPTTRLGKRLWAQRQKIEASGEPLVPVNQLMEELRAARS